MSEQESCDSVTPEGAEDKEEAALKRAQDAVEELYWLNTHYFESHGVEDAARKESDVREKLRETLSILDPLQDSLSREQFAYLKGKALNVLPDHSPEAEALLASAVKRAPSLAGAWVCLGESYWKKGNFQQAYDCLTCSITHAKTKEALRSLSIVLRQMGTTPGERRERVRESVERAKEAVAEDVKDGTSWMILGNAYMSQFFTTTSDPKLLKQSMSAYNQAERDSAAVNIPDLHFNKATLCLYEEDYERALTELRRAKSLDPAWATPQDKMTETLAFLQAMTHSTSSKGKMKSKKAATVSASLSKPEKFTGSLSHLKLVPSFTDLNPGSNTGAVLVGGVLGIVPNASRVPYACVLVDSSGASLGLMVYNLAVSAHFNIGDIIAIPDPDLKHVHLENEKVDFGSIRCTDPHKILVNGEKLTPDKMAPSVLAIKTLI